MYCNERAVEPLRRREDGKLPSKAVCNEDRRLFMQAFQLNQDSYLLHQYSATTVESFLNKLVGGRKMF
jgi:hypothetical protein